MSTISRVLIVEDDLNALSGYLEFLTVAGFEAAGVANGADALRAALAEPPAAVVTDITMPGMNGFELAKALRQDSRTRNIPIIGLTGHWTADIHARARDAAMQVILAKPCIPAHLVAELERVLEHARAADDVSAALANLTAMNPGDVHDAPLMFRPRAASTPGFPQSDGAQVPIRLSLIRS